MLIGGEGALYKRELVSFTLKVGLYRQCRIYDLSQVSHLIDVMWTWLALWAVVYQ